VELSSPTRLNGQLAGSPPFRLRARPGLPGAPSRHKAEISSVTDTGWLIPHLAALLAGARGAVYREPMSPANPNALWDQERLGLLFAGLCALIAAFVPALAKLTTNRADPVFVATATTCFAGLLAAVVLGVRGQLRTLIGRYTGPRLLAVAALGTSIAFVLLYSGARRSTAIETVLCLQIEPAYSLLFSWWFLGHRPTARRTAAITVLLGGIFLALRGPVITFSSGTWFLLLTPLCWQVSHLIVLRGLAGVRAEVVTAARYIYGGPLLAVYWILTGGVPALAGVVDLAVLMALLALQGLVLCYVGTLLWYQAIARLDLGRSTAIVVPSIPLLSLVASFLLLGEVPTPMQCVGLAFIAAGVLAFLTAPQAVIAKERIPSLVRRQSIVDHVGM